MQIKMQNFAERKIKNVFLIQKRGGNKNTTPKN